MFIIYHSALSNDEICDTLDTLSPMDISVTSMVESAVANALSTKRHTVEETMVMEIWIQHVLSQFLRTRICTGLSDYDRMYCFLTKQYKALLRDIRGMIPYTPFNPSVIKLKKIDRQMMLFEVT